MRRAASEFIERHPVGRWFFNFLLITVLFAIGLYLRNAQQDVVSGQQQIIRTLSAEVHARCVENKKNRRALRKIVFRGLDVGKPGTPGYAYYLAHPKEKQAALHRVWQAIENLPPIVCGKPPEPTS